MGVKLSILKTNLCGTPAGVPVTLETRVTKMAAENTIPLSIFEKGQWDLN